MQSCQKKGEERNTGTMLGPSQEEIATISMVWKLSSPQEPLRREREGLLLTADQHIIKTLLLGPNQGSAK